MTDSDILLKLNFFDRRKHRQLMKGLLGTHKRVHEGTVAVRDMLHRNDLFGIFMHFLNHEHPKERLTALFYSVKGETHWGHFFLHPNTRQVDSVTQEQSNNWSDHQEIEEYEANLFAAELLMPTSMFAARIKGKAPSFELIESLQQEFRTTLTATAVQFVLTTKEECAIVSCANRQRLWFIVSPGFSFAMLYENFVHGRSCAAEVGVNKRISKSSRVEAGYWLSGFEHDHKSCITEEARYFSKLGRSLSLLWIKDAI